MASSPLIIQWNNFTWWVNDQKYQWQTGRYFSWYWVDTRRYDVRPTDNNNLIDTFGSSIRWLYNVQKAWGWDQEIVWLSNKEIYLREEWETSVLKATASDWGKRMAHMTTVWWDQKLYYFQDTAPSTVTKYIHRSNLDWSTFDDRYLTYTSDTWNSTSAPLDWMQIVEEWYRIIFSHYNSILQIDNNEVVTNLIEFPYNENVIWITQFQWQYRIYTAIWLTASRLHIWDWSSSTLETSVNLEWIAINSVINKWAYDYASAENDLYKFAGVQYQKIFDWKLGSRIDNLLGAYEDQIYLNYDSSDWIALAQYGTLPWYSEGINPIYSIDTTDIDDGIDGKQVFNYSSSWIYYSRATKLYTSTWTPESQATNSFLESLVFVWDNIQYEKSIENLILKFSGLTTNNIILYFQLDESWTWAKIWEGNNNSITSSNHWLKINKQMFLNPIGLFNTIRFKVEFPHTWDAEWRFYWIDLFGNQNVWK